MVVSSKHGWVIHFQIPPPKYSGCSTLPLTPQGRETGDLRSLLTVIVCDFWEEVCCSYSIKHRSSVPSLWESRLVSLWARWDILCKLQAVCPKQRVLPAVSYFIQVTSTNAGRMSAFSKYERSGWVMLNTFQTGRKPDTEKHFEMFVKPFLLKLPFRPLGKGGSGSVCSIWTISE